MRILGIGAATVLIVAIPLGVILGVFVLQDTIDAQEPYAPNVPLVAAFEKSAYVAAASLALRDGKITDQAAWTTVRAKVRLILSEWDQTDLDSHDIRKAKFHFVDVLEPPDAPFELHLTAFRRAQLAKASQSLRDKAAAYADPWCLSQYAVARAYGVRDSVLVAAWDRAVSELAADAK